MQFFVTKRQLGLFFIAGGVLGVLGVPLFDLIRHHAFGGAFQIGALLGSLLIGMVGATLIPLGGQPA